MMYMYISLEKEHFATRPVSETSSNTTKKLSIMSWYFPNNCPTSLQKVTKLNQNCPNVEFLNSPRKRLYLWRSLVHWSMEQSTRLDSMHSSISLSAVLQFSSLLLQPPLIGSKFHGDTLLSQESLSLSQSGELMQGPAAMYPILLFRLTVPFLTLLPVPVTLSKLPKVLHGDIQLPLHRLHRRPTTLRYGEGLCCQAVTLHDWSINFLMHLIYQFKLPLTNSSQSWIREVQLNRLPVGSPSQAVYHGIECVSVCQIRWLIKLG